MQSIQFITQANTDGFLQVKIPPELRNIPVEVMVVFQPVPLHSDTPVYPNDRFYGACADNSIAIDNQGIAQLMDDDSELIDGVG